MIKKIIAKNIYEPLYYIFYRRDNALKYYNNFKKAQWNSLEDNKNTQRKQLYSLIKFATEQIPYYNETVINNGITFSEETIFDDIKKFPILTKEILRKEFSRLHKVNPKVPWYYNTSGGSTGEPAKFVQDRNFEAQSEAVTRIQYDWCNYESGEAFVHLWAAHTELTHGKESFKHRFAKWIKSIIILDAISMNETSMEEYIKIINKKKPKLILAYAQSIIELTDFIRRNNIQVYSPRAVMTSANVLYEHSRRDIENTFGCPVINRYGSREVGNIACECEKKEGLHLSIFTHYIEILNSELQPCKEGEAGEVYVTLLTNFTMPLIRYKIGDVAVFTEQNCSCGRGMPLIKEIMGRNNDIFITSSGAKIHTALINMQFYFRDWVRQYQVLQKNPEEIVIKISVAENAPNLDEEFSEIENSLKQVMGQNCKVIFEIVERIEPTQSGKYRYTIREF